MCILFLYQYKLVQMLKMCALSCNCVLYNCSYFFFLVPFLSRYTLRNKDHDDVCEDLVLMLTDTLNGELSDVGPEDVLPQIKLEELQFALTKQVI